MFQDVSLIHGGLGDIDLIYEPKACGCPFNSMTKGKRDNQHLSVTTLESCACNYWFLKWTNEALVRSNL